MFLKDKNTLITQEKKDCKELVIKLEERGAKILLCPLEKYVPLSDSDIKDTLEHIEHYDNIIYGNLRNATFFFEHIYDEQILEKILNRINFALDQPTADFLEDRGIPAITSAPYTKPIELIELMLRLGQTGSCLYPCGRHFKEELPGLLFELGIDFNELETYDRLGPSEQELERYRAMLQNDQPDIVVFHNIDSVRRTKIAFPDLNWDNIKTVALSAAIADKMRENRLNVDNVISLEDVQEMNHKQSS
jgi:uroporphyrinogen-III synthase